MDFAFVTLLLVTDFSGLTVGLSPCESPRVSPSTRDQVRLCLVDC